MNTSHPHRRWHPLKEEWILVSPHRAARPWQGAVEKVAPLSRPSYDGGCYLCPGNTRHGGAVNPPYSGVFVFQNDFAALLPDGGNSEPSISAVRGVVRAESEGGICRVICFSPRHDLTLPQMSLAEIGAVISVWAEQYAELGSRPEIGHVMIFENKGEIMGCSNPHPHGQIWATATIPTLARRGAEAQRRFFGQHGTSLLGEYLAWELSEGVRVVEANEAWVAVVPFWATWPFEILLMPKRVVATVGELTSDERQAWARILKNVLSRYDRLFDCSFPYSMGLYQVPPNGEDWPGFTLHQVFYPPLLRSATVKKFMVGYEMCAEAQRDLTPEQAAERLRQATEGSAV